MVAAVHRTAFTYFKNGARMTRRLRAPTLQDLAVTSIFLCWGIAATATAGLIARRSNGILLAG
jgi:hypothetical protein